MTFVKVSTSVKSDVLRLSGVQLDRLKKKLCKSQPLIKFNSTIVFAVYPVSVVRGTKIIVNVNYCYFLPPGSARKRCKSITPLLHCPWKRDV